jgi:hypothetical protein
VLGSSPKSGKATNRHVIHFDGLASSETSLLFIDGTGMKPAGCITPGDLGVVG